MSYVRIQLWDRSPDPPLRMVLSRRCHSYIGPDHHLSTCARGHLLHSMYGPNHSSSGWSLFYTLSTVVYMVYASIVVIHVVVILCTSSQTSIWTNLKPPFGLVV